MTRFAVIVAIVLAALAYAVNWLLQRVVLVVLIVLTLALSGCVWIAPPPYRNTDHDRDLLCRPYWDCAPRYHGGDL